MSLPLTASAQSFVNPDTTQQPGDIYIQNTDVYYHPMAPDTSDSRESLSNLGDKLLDPNGVGSAFHHPVVHGDTALQNWIPPGDTGPLGDCAIWQRFFTARRKWSGSASNIIAGSNVTNDTLHTNGHHGEVIISKNEDVDFRASGTIKMESGFHVMPGAFFHAYQEPRWGDSVLSDDFNSGTLDRSKWRVTNSHNDDYEFFEECSSDSNARMDTDYQATDGHALDIILREVPDTCSCLEQNGTVDDTCNDQFHPSPTVKKFAFSSGMLRSCPFPWVSRDALPLIPVYAHAPYGKYEVREKIPHVMHHTNNWEYDQFEYDMNETWNGNMNELHPGGGPGGFWHGPLKGAFGPKSLTDTTRVFRSSQANWCASNIPTSILVGANFDFDINLNLTPTDTFLTVSGTTQNMGGFPSSYADSTGSISFYYRRQANNTSDLVTWTVSPDDTGSYRIFSAPFHILHSVPLIFSKGYQPTSITLQYDHFGDSITLHCHWIDSLNDPTNYGKLWLDDTLPVYHLDSNTERYAYIVSEEGYPVPPYGFNGMDTTGGSYQYHTFTMELLPHETRILMDSNVVWRSPDRLIPPGNPFYDWASFIPRSPVGIHPAEAEIDGNANGYDLFGKDTTTFVYKGVRYWNSITGQERQYFDQHPHNPGMWDVTIGGKTYHAAHHLIDYVRIWDVPADVKIPDFPR
ncbi:MAG TPA: hypothetical protein VG537_00945 [Candidatus Kapabacteria bacterium]|nr:hypothetical protein [Candidatus Kapabacteria bacterium]